MSYAKILKSLRFRVMTRTLLLLAISLVVVSTTIYFLLASTLRKNEQRQMVDFRNTYLNLFEERKLDTQKLPQDMLFVIKNSEGDILFEHYPTYLDKDYEDEEELEQLKKDVHLLNLEKNLQPMLFLKLLITNR